MAPIQDVDSASDSTSRTRRRSRVPGAHAHASPALVLEALRAETDPATSKRLPTILKLAAHLQLVGERVSRAAAVLLGSFEDLPPDLAVNRQQRRALIRLAARDDTRLMQLSINMRRESMFAALRKDPHKTTSVEGLLEQYFPALTTVDDARESRRMLFVRAMGQDDLARLAEARAAVLAAIEGARRGVVPERGVTLAELGDELLEAAEDVVADADELEAMFPKRSKRPRESLPAPRDEHPRKHTARKSMPAAAMA